MNRKLTIKDLFLVTFSSAFGIGIAMMVVGLFISGYLISSVSFSFIMNWFLWLDKTNKEGFVEGNIWHKFKYIFGLIIFGLLFPIMPIIFWEIYRK